MGAVKYTNLTDMDIIYLLVNSTHVYYDTINDKCHRWVNV